METTRKIDAKAARRKRRLIREWITYAVICAFLAGVNALTTPHYWWVLWVMAGWGLGLILDLIFQNGCQRTDTRICKEKSGMLKYIIIKTHCVWKREN